MKDRLALIAEICKKADTKKMHMQYADHLLAYWHNYSRWSMAKVNKAFSDCYGVTEDELRKYPHGCQRFEDRWTLCHYISHNFPNTNYSLCRGWSRAATLNRFMEEKNTQGAQIRNKTGFGVKRIYL